MRRLIRKWLGISALENITVIQRGAIVEINTYLDSREPCKTCGHHRYTKRAKRYDEIERDRKRRKKSVTL